MTFSFYTYGTFMGFDARKHRIWGSVEYVYEDGPVSIWIRAHWSQKYLFIANEKENE